MAPTALLTRWQQLFFDNAFIGSTKKHFRTRVSNVLELYIPISKYELGDSQERCTRSRLAVAYGRFIIFCIDINFKISISCTEKCLVIAPAPDISV